jgi:hypothetical protein
VMSSTVAVFEGMEWATEQTQAVPTGSKWNQMLSYDRTLKSQLCLVLKFQFANYKTEEEGIALLQIRRNVADIMKVI